MAKYFRDNFEWDFGSYLSQIHLVSSKVSDSIRKFTECLENQKEIKSEDIEIIEDYGGVELPVDLLTSLTSLSEILKNEVFYNSLLLTAYSFLEFSLIEYCRLMQGYIKKDIDLVKIKQTGLLKSRIFLQKAFDLDITSLENWVQIDAYRKHRNLIAHDNANIYRKPNRKLEEQKDFELYNSNENLDLTETGHVFIKEITYINNLYDIASQFLNEIIGATREKIEVD